MTPFESTKVRSAELALLLRGIDEGYQKATWHGPNLKGSLRGVSRETALWRAATGRKNIWELTLHAAYWKYTVTRRIRGEQRGLFPLKGSNWFKRDETFDDKQWQADRKLLDAIHKSMRAAIESLDGVELGECVDGGKVTYEMLIRGVAMHDVYHAGQIQLLKKQFESLG